jgi:uncharacterized protein YcfL
MIRALLVSLLVGVGCGRGAAPPQVHDQAAAVVGARAPDGQLTRASGDKVAMTDVLRQHAQTVVVFYRGFW